jgi:hypothetical protein
MSYTAEPFFIPTDDGVTAPLRAAGFTDAAYKDCLTGALPLERAPSASNLESCFDPSLISSAFSTGWTVLGLSCSKFLAIAELRRYLTKTMVAMEIMRKTRAAIEI